MEIGRFVYPSIKVYPEKYKIFQINKYWIFYKKENYLYSYNIASVSHLSPV